MMTEGKDAGSTWENPLIPNARLRQIYLAMMRARVLGRMLPRARRGGAAGIEACLVSPAADLGPRDVLCDALDGRVVEFLRGATLEAVVRRDGSARRREPKADCGVAMRVPAIAVPDARIWSALGAAATLKAMHAQQRADDEAKPGGVAVVYARQGEVSARVWRSALEFAVQQQLPVLFVLVPAAGKAMVTKAGGMSALALGCGLPGIPVDMDDAVAIYRVAQESIGRARIGGGPAVMECVRFAVEGAARRRKPPADAIAALEEYLLQRCVCSAAWMEREAKTFARQIAAVRAASKERSRRVKRRGV